MNEYIFEIYKRGALIEHVIPKGNRYTSTPDSELILQAVNALQDPQRMYDYMRANLKYTWGGIPGYIREFRITPPTSTTSVKHDIRDPHPRMSDAEIFSYLWPTSELNRKKETYEGTLWIGIERDEPGFIGEQTPSGEFLYGEEADIKWIKLINKWPIMVGSNRCNVAIMRSYFDDDTPLPPRMVIDEDEARSRGIQKQETYGDRAEYILDMVGYDRFIPDGYFIISGKMKRFSSVDKLQMNMIYNNVVSSGITMGKTIYPVGNKVTEVRSVRPTKGGMSFHRFFMYIEPVNMPKANSMPYNQSVYKTHMSRMIINIGWKFGPDKMISVLEFLMGYMYLIDTYRDEEDEEYPNLPWGGYTSLNKESVYHMFHSMMREYVGFNKDIEISLLTMKNAVGVGAETLGEYIYDSFELEYQSDGVLEYLDKMVMPHCDTIREKVAYICLCVGECALHTMKRINSTDKRHYMYKRWDTPGELMREYLRSTLLYNLGTMSKGDDMVSLMRKNEWIRRFTPGRTRKTDNRLNGVIDDMVTTNRLSMINSIRTHTIPTAANMAMGEIRKIHPSQWGYLCPANTPENDNIGLNNHRAELALASPELTSEERNTIMEKIQDLEEVRGSDPENISYLLMVESVPYKHVYYSAYETLRDMKIREEIPKHVGIIVDTFHPGILDKRVIVVRYGYGRPVIPMLNLAYGMIEYVDPYEMDANVVVSVDGEDGEPYTHRLLSPTNIYSRATNCLSFSEHDPPARTTYASSHIVQAIGYNFRDIERRFDHEQYALNDPRRPFTMTDTGKRLQLDICPFGTNVSMLVASFTHNLDDGVVFSRSFADSGALDGYYVSVEERRGEINRDNMYNGDLSQRYPYDPWFVDSMIVSYGEPYTVDKDRKMDGNIYLEQENITMIGNRPIWPSHVYDPEDGYMYIPYGIYRTMRIWYSNGTYRDIIPGQDVKKLPGLNITRTEKGGKRYIYAIAFVSGENLGEVETKFLQKEPIFKYRGVYWYGMGKVHVPRVTIRDFGGNIVIGGQERTYVATIRKKMWVKRGDTCIKVKNIENGYVVGIHKEKFEVTWGYVVESSISDGYGRVKVHMPIYPKPGNKYAALYAQKSICAKIRPDHEMPYSYWYNEVTEEWEYQYFHVIFNPLAFPSRMTVGQIYELIYADTAFHMCKDFGDIESPSRYERIKESLSTLNYIEGDPDPFSDSMYDLREIEDAYEKLQKFTDSTPYKYDRLEGYEECKEVREKLGIPVDGKYPTYIRDVHGKEHYMGNMYAGICYYVALKHLADNKIRSRGFVGKLDPITLQPVKGRKRDGGANTGTQEADAYKAHGAISFLEERLKLASDHRILYKCPRCASIMCENPVKENRYICLGCDYRTNDGSQIFKHDTVYSWHMFRKYLRALGINLMETFE